MSYGPFQYLLPFSAGVVLTALLYHSWPILAILAVAGGVTYLFTGTRSAPGAPNLVAVPKTAY